MKASKAITDILQNKDAREKMLFETRGKIEDFFEKTGHLLYRNRFKTLLTVFTFVTILTFQIPNMTIETSSESLLREDDQIRIDYNIFREEFGRSGMIFIAIESTDVFNFDFLLKLKSFHNDLEKEVPYIRKINSLINITSVRVDGSILITEERLRNWPEQRIDLDYLRKETINNAAYINNIISKDGSVTGIVMETRENVFEPEEGKGLTAYFQGDKKAGHQRRLSAGEISEVVGAVRRVSDRYRSEDFSIALSGGILIADVYNKLTIRDMRLCLSLGLITIAFFLALFFRRISGIIIPMIVINSSMFSVWGLMSILNIPIRLPTTVLPAFLLAVCVGDSVHLLAVFYKSFQQGKNKEDAISYALKHSGLPVFLTSVTTAASLLSFAFAEISAVAEIGIFGAVGVMLAFLFTVVMLPPLISLTPLRQRGQKSEKSELMDKALLSFAGFSTAHPVKILVTCLILFFLSIVFIFRLELSHNQIEWFPDTMEVKKDIKFIDRTLGGTITLEVIIDTKKKSGIFTNEILDGIEKFSINAEKIETQDIFVGKVFSINTFIKELNRSFHNNDPAYFTIPRNMDKIPLDLFLSVNEAPGFVKSMVDSRFSKARITIKTPWVDSDAFNGLIETVKKQLKDIFSDRVNITITGGMALVARAIPAAMHSMAQSYIIAFLVIAVIMIVLVGDLKVGLLTMLPNLLPIAMVMGGMGLIGIPLDSVTIMIGSIAIGLVVDNTVHFLYNFQKYHQRRKDPYEAVKQTMLGTGRALMITSFVLSAGFFALMFASLNNMIRFGLFTGLTIVLALLADFLLLPALMVLVSKSEL